MKKPTLLKTLLIVLFIFSLICGHVNAQDKGIHFEKRTWKKVLALAEKKNKLIFLDAYTTWCGPCIWMEKNTFIDEKVSKFYNEYFINVRINIAINILKGETNSQNICANIRKPLK